MKERNFFGTTYESKVATQQAKDIASAKKLPTQIEIGAISKHAKELFDAIKAQQFQRIDGKIKEFDFKEIRKNGGKFLFTKYDLQIYICKPIKVVENSGKINVETIIYFPQTDESKIIGSITSLLDRARVQLKKLGTIVDGRNF